MKTAPKTTIKVMTNENILILFNENVILEDSHEHVYVIKLRN